jgi:hypothetical protein
MEAVFRRISGCISFLTVGFISFYCATDSLVPAFWGEKVEKSDIFSGFWPYFLFFHPECFFKHKYRASGIYSKTCIRFPLRELRLV